MAKRKLPPETVNLILLIISLAAAVFAFEGMLGSLIAVYVKRSNGGVTTKSHWSIGDWFENINDMSGFDHIGYWQIARVLLIVTMLLLLALVVLQVLRIFKKQNGVKAAVIGVGIAVLVSAVLYLLLTLIGCGVLSTKIVLTASLTTTVNYLPGFGAFAFGLGAIVSAVLAEVLIVRTRTAPRHTAPRK